MRMQPSMALVDDEGDGAVSPSSAPLLSKDLDGDAVREEDDRSPVTPLPSSHAPSPSPPAPAVSSTASTPSSSTSPASSADSAVSFPPFHLAPPSSAAPSPSSAATSNGDASHAFSHLVLSSTSSLSSSPVPSPPSVAAALPPPSAVVDVRNLYVDNLPALSDVELRNLFLPYGPILKSRVAIDPSTHLPSGYGFVMFERAEDAQRAVDGLHGHVLGTKKLRVTVKKPRVQPQHSPAAAAGSNGEGGRGAGTSHVHHPSAAPVAAHPSQPSSSFSAASASMALAALSLSSFSSSSSPSVPLLRPSSLSLSSLAPSPISSPALSSASSSSTTSSSTSVSGSLTNLYVSGVPVQWGKVEVERLFSSYGSILDSRVLQDRTTGKSRGVCMVRFEQKAAAALAITQLHNRFVPPSCSIPIVVKYAHDRLQGGTQGQAQVHPHSPQLQASQSLFTPSSLPLTSRTLRQASPPFPHHRPLQFSTPPASIRVLPLHSDSASESDSVTSQNGVSPPLSGSSSPSPSPPLHHPHHPHHPSVSTTGRLTDVMTADGLPLIRPTSLSPSPSTPTPSSPALLKSAFSTPTKPRPSPTLNGLSQHAASPPRPLPPSPSFVPSALPPTLPSANYSPMGLAAIRQAQAHPPSLSYSGGLLPAASYAAAYHYSAYTPSSGIELVTAQQLFLMQQAQQHTQPTAHGPANQQHSALHHPGLQYSQPHLLPHHQHHPQHPQLQQPQHHPSQLPMHSPYVYAAPSRSPLPLHPSSHAHPSMLGLSMLSPHDPLQLSHPSALLPSASTAAVPSPPPLSPSLYVYGLPSAMTESDLRELFAIYGHVSSVAIMKNDNGTPKGYAFVNMQSVQEAELALAYLDHFAVGGRVLRVQFKKPGGGSQRGQRSGQSAAASGGGVGAAANATASHVKVQAAAAAERDGVQ